MVKNDAAVPVQPAALTIAGSDSSGGAGIQADIKTFSALGVYGCSAITCLTAQNPEGVRAMVEMDSAFVGAQIRAVCDSFPILAAKTGMLYSREIIETVAAEDVREGIAVLVVDPVMVSAAGDRLLKADAMEALQKILLPEARIVTPNIHEAEIFCNHPIRSLEEMRAAAREIGDHFDVACVIKGGRLKTPEAVDVLYDEGEEATFSVPRVEAVETHGTGCAFSAALTAWLARGILLRDAVMRAKEFVTQALLQSPRVGKHRPLRFCGTLHIEESTVPQGP